MKRFFAALLSVCLLTGCLMLPAASEEEETFYIYSESAFGLLRNVGEALAEGADPAAVRAKMAQVAEEMDFQQEFEFACENVAAYDNANYRKIRKLLDGEEQRRLDIRTPAAGDSYWGSWSAYEMPEELNDAARAFLEDPKAEYCFEPFWWLETDFKSVLGTPFDSFKLTRDEDVWLEFPVKVELDPSATPFVYHYMIRPAQKELTEGLYYVDVLSTSLSAGINEYALELHVQPSSVDAAHSVVVPTVHVQEFDGSKVADPGWRVSYAEPEKEPEEQPGDGQNKDEGSQSNGSAIDSSKQPSQINPASTGVATSVTSCASKRAAR